MRSATLTSHVWTGTLAVILSASPLFGGGSIRIKEAVAGPLVDFGVATLPAALNLIGDAPEITLTITQGKPESFSVHRSGYSITSAGGDATPGAP